MKKALFYIVFLGIVAGFSSTSFAAVSCVPGDKFDIFTGKACVVATTVVDKDAQIAALQAQVAFLLIQVDALKAQISTTNASSTKEIQLKAVDAQILPLLAMDTSNTSLVNSLLAQYRTIDPNFLYKTNIPYVSQNLNPTQLDAAYIQLNASYKEIYNYLIDQYIPNRNK